MRNADEWGMAFIVLGTIVITALLPATPSRVAHSGQKSAQPVLAQDNLDYKIVVTGYKMPAECKNLSADAATDLVSKCNELSARETQMTLKAVNATVQVADQP